MTKYRLYDNLIRKKGDFAIHHDGEIWVKFPQKSEFFDKLKEKLKEFFEENDIYMVSPMHSNVRRRKNKVHYHRDKTFDIYSIQRDIMTGEKELFALEYSDHNNKKV